MTEEEKRLLAEFIHEGLCGLGVLDECRELLYYTYQREGDAGLEAARKRYNAEMQFVNDVLGKQLRLIDDEDIEAVLSP